MQQAVPGGEARAPGADSKLEPIVWRAQTSDELIEFDRQMMEAVRFECSRAMNGIGGTGIGGVLLGSCDGDVLRVDGWRPLACDHSRGPAFLMSERDLAGVAALIEGLDAQSAEGGPGVAGCFISHPREGLTPTGEELAWHKRFFGPGLPLIIIRPDRLGSMECAVYRNSAEPVGGLIEVDPLPVVKRAPGERRRRRPVKTVVRTPARVHAVSEVSKPMRLWLLGAVLAIICIIVVGTLVARTRSSQAARAVAAGVNAPMEVMSLHARPSGKRLVITWNGKADSIPYIQDAALLIRDGKRRVRVPLSRTKLMAGKYLYERPGRQVQVLLLLRGANGQEMEEKTLYRNPALERPEAIGLTLDAAPAGRR